MKTCTHCGRRGQLGYVRVRYAGLVIIECADEAACSARTSARLVEAHVREARIARMRAALMERQG